MKAFLRNVIALAAKDVRLELRSKEAFFSTLLFVILILVILNFSFGNNAEITRKVAPAILWIVIAFSGTIAISHLTRHEVDNNVQEGLLLTGAGGVTFFFAKFVSALLFLTVVELIAIPLFVVLYNFDLGDWFWTFLMILFLGTIGYTAVGTLFATLLCRARLRDLLLPVIFYPVIIPWFIMAVAATSSAMEGAVPPQITFFLGFDMIFITAAALFFDFVVEDVS